ncbi:MAG: glycosyltransferase family 2 protein [Tardiphaga sp.]
MIPSYRAAATVLPVIAGIGPEVARIVVVDDGCPQHTGIVVATHCADPRVVVLMHDVNRGVGAAFLTGMRYAIAEGAEVIIKIDADGQMDPAEIVPLMHPIASGQADYVKGDRFFFLTGAASMPSVRLFGNLALSFMAKFSTGYWTVMDPTNGFFAIHGRVAELLDDDRITKRFFFESDLLFHLGLLRAKVVEYPMRARYGDEVSNLRVSRQLAPFLKGHARNALRRILYRYFFREFSLASLQLIGGAALSGFGLAFGGYHWCAAAPDQLVPTGTIMVAALTFLTGFQLLLSFLNYDISASPRDALHPLLGRTPRTVSQARAIVDEQSRKERRRA